MIIQTGLGHTFLEELPLGIHILSEGSPSDEIKVALYGPNAILNRNYPQYTTAGELAGGGYTAGGYTLTNGLTLIGRDGSGRGGPTQFSFAYLQPTDDFQALVSGVGIRGLMMYNATRNDRNIFTLDFGRILNPSVGINIAWGINSITQANQALIPLKGQTT